MELQEISGYFTRVPATIQVVLGGSWGSERGSRGLRGFMEVLGAFDFKGGSGGIRVRMGDSTVSVQGAPGSFTGVSGAFQGVPEVSKGSLEHLTLRAKEYFKGVAGAPKGLRKAAGGLTGFHGVPRVLWNAFNAPEIPVIPLK